MKKIDLNSWNRKAHFENFLQFQDPFFNICGDVKVTGLKHFTQQNNHSFFITSYHLILQAVNAVEEFRYRIQGEDVVLYEKINGSCTVLRNDRTFGYGYFTYIENLEEFTKDAKQVIDGIRNGEGLEPKFDLDNLIHSSVIPWTSFRSIEHAKRLNQGDSIPKLVTGKLYEANGEIYMPISVSAHHALVDGLHVGELFEFIERRCEEM